MRKRTGLGIIFMMTVMAGFFAIPAVHAQTTEDAEITSAKCTTAKAKISAQMTKVDATKADQLKTYAELSTKIDTIVSSATNNKYDKIADIIAVRDTIHAKTTVYTQVAISYSADLHTLSATDCDTDTSQFTTTLATARKDLTLTRTASTDVQAAFKEQVIPALTAYASWLKAQAGTGVKD